VLEISCLKCIVCLRFILEKRNDMNKIDTLPRWDVSVIYPSLKSAEFEAGFADLITEIDEMIQLFGDFDVQRQTTSTVNIEITQNVETILQKMGDLDENISTLYAYIHSFVSTDSRNELAQAKRSDMQRQLQRLSVLETRFNAWIGSLDVNALIEGSAFAAEHSYMLQQAAIQAQHQMSPEKEELASNLTLSGGSAWAKLHSTYSSQLLVELETNGVIEHLPMSATRNLAYSPERRTRERAYRGELAAWEAAAVPFAACLNGVKGEVDALCKEREWSTPLDAALFDNGIDHTILDAMMEAAHESFPDFRRYLRAKAKMLGLERLAWYDLRQPTSSWNNSPIIHLAWANWPNVHSMRIGSMPGHAPVRWMAPSVCVYEVRSRAFCPTLSPAMPG